MNRVLSAEEDSPQIDRFTFWTYHTGHACLEFRFLGAGDILLSYSWETTLLFRMPCRLHRARVSLAMPIHRAPIQSTPANEKGECRWSC